MKKTYYKDLFFNKPTEILNLLDNLVFFEHQRNYIYVYTSNDSPYQYQVPLKSNVELLEKFMNVEDYISSNFDLKDQKEIIEGVESIDLSQLFNDMDNNFQITIKVDIDENFIVYCDKDDFSNLFNITESNS